MGLVTKTPFSREDNRRLISLRKNALKPLETMTVWCSKSDEPTPFSEKEQGKFFKLVKGFAWTGTIYECAWMHIVGNVPADYESRRERLFLHMNVGGEGLLYTPDGLASDMISDRHMHTMNYTPDEAKNLVPLRDCYIKDGKVDFWMEVGFNGEEHDKPFGKAYFHFAEIVEADSEESDFIYDYLTVTMLKNSPDVEKAEEMEKCLKKAFDERKNGNREAARETLKPFLESIPLDFDVYAVGHSHLDLAWLWPVRETKRKAERTFTRQLYNLEKYPEYIYGASQPWQFEQIKERKPELYEKIKKAVADGRLELQGGMYVEADTNVSGGEALIRQFHYGMDFFKKEFGKDMQICWLPDVFGYNGNLPQIIKKSGMDYFFTIKLSWNEHNRFPHRSFNWYGIDGSRVLVHMAPAETYNSAASPLQARLTYSNYPEKTVSDEAMMVFGMGDGGGGPSDSHLEYIKREKTLDQVPRVHYAPAEDFFHVLEKREKMLPVFHGELYLEKHQGTYTTQAKNKMYNRRGEFALQDLETLSAQAWLRGLPYDQKMLDRYWKEILFYQFHDILPGSSVHRVYEESVEHYRNMIPELGAKRRSLIEYLGGKDEKEYAYNPSPYARKALISGKVAEVPAFSSAPLMEQENLSADLSYGTDYISNGKLTVRFNRNGDIVSMVDASGTEYCGDYLNRLVVYHDPKSHYNAWDINWKYFKRPGKRLRMVAQKTLLEDDSVIVRRQAYLYGRSMIIQELRLGALDDVLYVKNEISWHETHKMLRAESRPSFFSDSVSCDIQYGTISRTTKDKTLLEQAQFEICAQKYVDVSDPTHGLSLLNDCKYGHRVKEGLISLNLLRSPVYPDPTADRGDHAFTYAFYPHEGKNLLETQKRAYWLNLPLKKIGAKEAFTCPVSVPEESGVVLAQMKKSYEGDRLVLRLYESQGKDAVVVLNGAERFNRIFEADLQENNANEIFGNYIHFSPFEIKTIELE